MTPRVALRSRSHERCEGAEELLGHSHVDTTMIYTHVLNRGPGVISPLDDGLVGAQSNAL